MKLIASGPILSKKLKGLIERHEHIAISVAWASAGTEVFRSLIKHKKKIQHSTIGTHFYQTHPDVLDAFTGSRATRFMLQPRGVFHPKAYAFWSKSGWDVLLGSANLTAGAMGTNSELVLHISSNSAEADFLQNLLVQLRKYWEGAETVTAETAGRYRTLWHAQQPALRRVSGAYSDDGNGKAPVHTEVMSMTWSEFYKRVKADPYHGFDKRCDLLEVVNGAFRRHGTFAEMELGMRKTIAGLPNDLNEHWGWFGSMKGAGYYHQAVNENNVHISAALDHIPLDGEVSRRQYDAYVEEFIKAFPQGRHGIGIASRLLALKRPDTFVCLDAKNKSQLCKDFGAKQTGMSYERYWDELICRIRDSVWWGEEMPDDEKEARVWSGRAAMLDAIFYEP